MAMTGLMVIPTQSSAGPGSGVTKGSVCKNAWFQVLIETGLQFHFMDKRVRETKSKHREKVSNCMVKITKVLSFDFKVVGFGIDI
jgi:hypothetical protein